MAQTDTEWWDSKGMKWNDADDHKTEQPLVHWAMIGEEPAGMCWDGDCYPDIAQAVSNDINEVTCSKCRSHFRILNDLKKATVARLEKELGEARSEMSTCDDIKLNQPLANCVADLQRERERLEKERDGLRLALEELPAQYVKGVTCAMTVREVYDWLKEAAEARIRELEGGK